MESKKEAYSRFDAVGRGKLILSRKLLSQIDYLHNKVGQFEWIGVLLYTKEAGDIPDGNTLVLRAHKLYLMDIGTTAHTQATIDAEEVLGMYDNVPDIMDLKQGLIHTHHIMTTFFSGEDWSELEDNTPLHNYYLSLIVNFDGKYSAKVAYMANVEENFTFKGCDDQSFTTSRSKKVLITLDMNIEKEGVLVDEPFEKRYEEVKEAKTVITTYVGGYPKGPYHAWPKHDEPVTYKRIDQGEVGQEKTFRGGEPYRNISNVFTYSQSKEVLLEWLNEGLRMEAVTKAAPFITILEGLAWFQCIYEGKFNDGQYKAFINMMQKVLVDVSSEYQPSVTSQRLKVLLGEFKFGNKTSRIAGDLAELAEYHPTFMQIMRKHLKQERKEDKRKNKSRAINHDTEWGD